MQRTDFNYYLPPHLIAQQPNRYRASSRLLWVNSPPEPFQNRRFIDLPHLLSPGDLLIFIGIFIIGGVISFATNGIYSGIFQ